MLITKKNDLFHHFATIQCSSHVFQSNCMNLELEFKIWCKWEKPITNNHRSLSHLWCNCGYLIDYTLDLGYNEWWKLDMGEEPSPHATHKTNWNSQFKKKNSTKKTPIQTLCIYPFHCLVAYYTMCDLSSQLSS